MIMKKDYIVGHQEQSIFAPENDWIPRTKLPSKDSTKVEMTK